MLFISGAMSQVQMPYYSKNKYQFYFCRKYGYWAKTGPRNGMLSGGKWLNFKYHTMQ
jgi:hypothetical protein